MAFPRPISTEFREYVPQACKPKPKPAPKAKSMATTKTAEHSRSGVSSEIDDEFTMLDWNASLPSPYEAPNASHLVGSADVAGGFGAASKSEKLEHYQSNRQSIVGGGTDHVTSVAKTDLALNRLFNRNSLAKYITDLTLCPVPKGLLIVIAIVRNRDSKWSLDPAALRYRVLGKEGKVIRMTQLSPDSWILLGFRYDNDDLGLSIRGSSNADWMSSSHTAVNQESDHLDDDSDEEEDIEKHSQRTHKRWLKSDDARLLSYKDKQGMEWEQFFNRFPERSSSAVKQRYTILLKKGL
ncbi:hypothetical protein K458DRAFT_384383 [Lentithecium fluviatile CBS 122367]|uniref:Myb-like domain-containing protein n=1 Tax=Lentithecium fluviatile CBS 122367 TaxID=1168545 RepID=A0A6G1JGQ2_9PLEO|nr:hypothetical protein K458DRAFT_384383 [Lentithecium fluviatile CBS 122367]